VRWAKSRGLRVSCEVTPHHFTLIDEDVQYDSKFKMNPPLAAREDREALLAGLADGTVDAIATDHAPHEPALKDVEFDRAPFGVLGFETALGWRWTIGAERAAFADAHGRSFFTTGRRACWGLNGKSLEASLRTDYFLDRPRLDFQRERIAQQVAQFTVRAGEPSKVEQLQPSLWDASCIRFSDPRSAASSEAFLKSRNLRRLQKGV